MSNSPEKREFLQALLDARGDGGKLCPRCGCCEMFWEECEQCGGEGVDEHDCGEDCCCCLEPVDNMRCDTCQGKGGWNICSCDENGEHKNRETNAA